MKTETLGLVTASGAVRQLAETIIDLSTGDKVIVRKSLDQIYRYAFAAGKQQATLERISEERGAA